MKRVKNIFHEVSALVWREGKLHIARAVEVEIASQGKTKKEALDNLKEALELYFEDDPKLNPKSSFKNLTLEKVAVQYA